MPVRPAIVEPAHAGHERTAYAQRPGDVGRNLSQKRGDPEAPERHQRDGPAAASRDRRPMQAALVGHVQQVRAQRISAYGTGEEPGDEECAEERGDREGHRGSRPLLVRYQSAVARETCLHRMGGAISGSAEEPGAIHRQRPDQSLGLRGRQQQAQQARRSRQQPRALAQRFADHPDQLRERHVAAIAHEERPRTGEPGVRARSGSPRPGCPRRACSSGSPPIRREAARHDPPA